MRRAVIAIFLYLCRHTKKKRIMINLAIFASGEGTNAENILHHLCGNPDIKVVLLVASKPGIGAIARAEKFGVPTCCVRRAEWEQQDEVLSLLRCHEVDGIVLSGFLVRVPEYLVDAYAGRIVNIHPALLPKHGGKGMYGHYVHEDVLRCGDKESGITIHLVNGELDAGEPLFQAKCPVMPDDTPDTLASRVHELEYKHFPDVIIGWATSIGKRTENQA